ncbi:zinc finger, C2H2 type [Teladorsagia circumcincta]|uniref:Zinc finger, C2H2 type n=1 Tax=Teladorsagia circumcincta TaxID=45464 RepID=A0A2G9UXC4_TELCI|nr:zinc finger, C2H2 type [Teladorsagia circumcincta]
MSLLDVDGLPPEFLEPVEFEEVELIENDLDLEPNDGSAAVVYVNNDSDSFVPEEVYQWADGTVTVEKVGDNGEVALQPFIDGEDTVYNDPQFEYEEDVEVAVEGQPFLDLNIPANNSNPTHFVDCRSLKKACYRNQCFQISQVAINRLFLDDGVEYIEAGLFPVTNEGLVDHEIITGEETLDDCEMLDDCEVSAEYEAVAEAEPMNTGRRLDEIIESVVSGVPIKKRKIRPSRAPMLVQCQICGLMLKHASKIRAHIRTHTGDKPYVCMYCNEHFGTSGTLNMHVKRKHTSGFLRGKAVCLYLGLRKEICEPIDEKRARKGGTCWYEEIRMYSSCYHMYITRFCFPIYTCILTCELYDTALHRLQLMDRKAIINASVFTYLKEIANAEKEADRELRIEQQENLSCEYGQSDQLLVDPSTNMLVHVSEDGMVLEPEIEQHTFLQGEFVEENDEAALAEYMAGGMPDTNSPGSYSGATSEVIQYMPSDIGLDPGPSGVVGVPLIEAEDLEEGCKRLPHHQMEDKPECYRNESNVSDAGSATTKGRVVNIIRKKPPRPTILGRRQ